MMKGSDLTPRGGISFSHPADLTAIVNQNRMKLRVNRVAILQELQAEHVVGYLAQNGVLTAAEMRRVCTEKISPVAVLLDILAQKENRTKWYTHFINSLTQADVDMDQKRRYRHLVDFLENTIIRRKEQREDTQYPRYKPLPSIGQTQSQGTSPSSHGRISDDTAPNQGDTTPSVQSKTSQQICSQPQKISPRSEKTGTERQKISPRSEKTGTERQKISPRSEQVISTSKEIIPVSQQISPSPQHKVQKQEVIVIPIKEAKATDSNSYTLISGRYHQWVHSPATHRSRLPDPTDLLVSLDTTDDTTFNLQIKAEKQVLHRMKELELIYIMHRQKRLPTGFILCMADCVTQIVDDTENHHLYVKYIQKLKHDYNFYLMKELVGSFGNWLMETKLGDVQKNQTLLNQATKFGMNLFDLLDELGEYTNAEAVVSILTVWLMVQPCLETWIHGYAACVKLTRIRIRNFEFKQADNSLNSAVQYLNAIKLMSFGKDLVDESERMVATSWLMHELGNHHTAYFWAYDAIKEVRPENKLGIIYALSNGARCYSSKYSIKQAHHLAEEAVKQAGEHFGRIHPEYIKARITYIELVSEFCQPNEKILKLAKDTLKRCELMYQCEESILLAKVHMALSKAYVACKKFNEEAYLIHARKAQRIAMNCVDGMHPILAVFAEHLARCSLIKASIVPKPAPAADTLATMKITQLIYAASELSVSYRIYCACFGTSSYRAATAQALLAEILEVEENMEDAKTMYEDALKTYKSCLNKSSPYLCQLRTRAARFYYKLGDLHRALQLMDEALAPMIKNGKLDSGPTRVQWMEEALSFYVKATADTNDEERLHVATDLQDDWLSRTEYLQPLSLQDLNDQPHTIIEFRKTFMLWSKVDAKKVTSLGRGSTSADEDEVEVEVTPPDNATLSSD